jgi:hypothetical protein
MLIYGGVFLFGMVAWVLSVLALWDCARRDFADPNTRAGWSIAIMLGHWIGALIYYVVVYRNGDPPYQPRPPREDLAERSVLEDATAPRRRTPDGKVDDPDAATG